MASLYDALLTGGGPRGNPSLYDRMMAESRPTLPEVQAADIAAAQHASPFEKGFRSTSAGMWGGAKGGLGLALETLRYPNAANAMYADANEELRYAQSVAPPVTSLRQIESPTDAASFALSSMGMGAASIPLGIAGGLGARALGAPALAGATAAYAPVMVGGENMQMRNDPKFTGDPYERNLRSLLSGGAQAGLEAVFPSMLLKRSPVGFGATLRNNMLTEGATEAGQDVISQANRADYDPNYNIDPMQTADAFAAGGLGAAPFALPHAAFASADKTAQDLYAKGKGVVGAVKEMGVDGAKQKVKSGADRLLETGIDAAANIGAKLDEAGGMGNIINEGIDKGIRAADDLADLAQATKETVKGKIQDKLDERQAREEILAPFKRTMDAFTDAARKGAITPDMAGDINHLWGELQKRGVTLSVPDMRKLRDIDSNPEYKTSAERDAARTVLLARQMRNVKHKQGVKHAEELLQSAVLDAHKSGDITKYSRLLGGNEANAVKDVETADKVKVGTSIIDKLIDNAFRSAGRTSPEDGPDYKKALTYTRMIANEGIKGKQDADTQSERIRALRDYLEFHVGDEQADFIAGALEQHFTEVPDGKKAASRSAALFKKESAWDFINKNVNRTSKGEYGDFNAVLDAVRRHDRQYDALKNATTSKDVDQEAELRRINDELEYEVKNLVKGQVGKTIMAARRINTFGMANTVPKNRQRHVLDMDTMNNLSEEERQQIEDEIGALASDEDSDISTETLTTPSGWENAPEFDKVPMSGWQNPDNAAIGGDIGSAKLKLSKQSEATKVSAADGKKPSKQTGGYVEISHETAPQRAARVAAETGRPYKEVLTEYAEAVRDRDAERMDRWSTKLLDAGVPLSDMITFLVSESEKHNLANTEAKTKGDVQTTFDGKKLIKEAFKTDDATALAVESIYWAWRRGEHLAKNGPEEFFKKFTHSFPVLRNQGGSHEALSHIDLNGAMLSDKALRARTSEKESITPDNGYLPVQFADQKFDQYLDLNVLMRKAVARSRNRTEALNDEEGRWNETTPFEANLRDDKGNFNMEYLTALRTGYGNLIVSLSQNSPDMKIPARSLKALQNPDTLLIRGTKGVGDIRVRDIMDTSNRKVETTDAELRKNGVLRNLKPGEGGKQSDMLKQGVVVRLRDGNGERVALNMPSLIKMAAKKFGYDLSGNPSRDALVYLAGQGIKSLSDAGLIKTEQGGPVALFHYSKQAKRYVFGNEFITMGGTDGPYLFDKTHTDSNGTRVNDRVVMSTRDLQSPYLRDPEILNPATEVTVKMRALLAVLKSEVAKRSDPSKQYVEGEGDALHAKAVADRITYEQRQLDGILNELRTMVKESPSFAEKMNEAHDLKAEIVRLEDQIKAVTYVERAEMPDVEKRAIKLKKLEASMKKLKGDAKAKAEKELAALRKQVADDRKNIDMAKNEDMDRHEGEATIPSKLRLRDDLTQKHWTDLLAMIENVEKALGDQTGQEDESFVSPTAEDSTATATTKDGRVITADAGTRTRARLEPGDDKPFKAVPVKTAERQSGFVTKGGVPTDIEGKPLKKADPTIAPKKGPVDAAWDAFVKTLTEDTVPDDYRRFSILGNLSGLYREGTSEEIAEAHNFIERVFGKDKVDLKVDDILVEGKTLIAGKFDPKELSPAQRLMIQLGVSGSAGILSTTFHESVHALAHMLRQTEFGKQAWERLDRGLNTPLMHRRIEKVLMEHRVPNVDAIMKDIRTVPEEAVAYAFQLQQMGMLTVGSETQGVFGRIAKALRKLFNLTTELSRSEAFMQAFVTGKLALADFKPSALDAAFGKTNGDRVMENIRNATEPLHTLVNTVFDSSVQALNRIGPLGKQLNELYAGYGGESGFVHHTIVQQRKFASQAQRIFDDYSKDEVQLGLKQLLAGEKLTNKAGQAIKDLLTSINKYAGRDPEHLSTVWDYDKIAKNRDAFEAALQDFGDTSEGKKIDSAEVLDVMNSLGFHDYNIDGKKRFDFLPQYAAEKANWVQTDPEKYMRSVIVNTVRAKEKAKIAKRVSVLLDRIKAENGNDAYYKAKQVIDGYEGKLGQNMNPAVRKLMHTALMVGNVVTLPLALFSASIDPFHIMSRTGGDLSAAAEAYARGIASIPNTVVELFGGKTKSDEMTRFAEDIGAIEHSMMTDLIGDIYLGDTAMGTTKRVNDWFFKANMLDGWTRQMRVAAVAAGQRFILAHAGGSEKTGHKYSDHYLKELGLTPDDIEVLPNGFLNIENPKIRMALNKFVDESIVRPDATTNAVWMNDARFALIAHMKRFTYAFNDKVLNRAVDEMGRGNAAPVIPLLASIPAILMADAGKHLLKMDYSTWMNGATFGDWVGYGAERAGLAGKFQFGLDAAYDVKAGGTPIDSFLGPEFGLVKKAVGHTRGTGQGELGLLGLMDDAYFLHRAMTAGSAFKRARDAESTSKKSVLGAMGAANDADKLLKRGDLKESSVEIARARHEIDRGNQGKPGQRGIAMTKIEDVERRLARAGAVRRAGLHEALLRNGYDE